MSKLKTFLLKTFKGIYDILATYLLVWVLYITLVSLGLHLVFGALASALDFESAELMWRVLARKAGTSQMLVQFAVFGSAQVLIFLLLRGPLHVVLSLGEKIVDVLQQTYAKIGRYVPRLRLVFSASFTLLVTLLLVPFIIQPTLVPMEWTSQAMMQRATNLLDGEATLGFADSVVGFYRRFDAEPEPEKGLNKEELDQAFAEETHGGIPSPDHVDSIHTIEAPRQGGAQPMMDRWDPVIASVSEDDPSQFAFIKAFMWVESAGRQFAVSHTGCSGLMQFCAPTARSGSFREIFGTGQVYSCGCSKNRCHIDAQIKRDMESGDKALVESHADAFPCELTDARFNAKKSIRAGGVYVRQLREAFGDNIYLMYIGYNSGPGVARKVYRSVGNRGDATLEEIEVHLADSLEQWYGSGAPRRARSLVRTHLPKIKGAYDRYYAATTQAQEVAVTPEHGAFTIESGERAALAAIARQALTDQLIERGEHPGVCDWGVEEML